MEGLSATTDTFSDRKSQFEKAQLKAAQVQFKIIHLRILGKRIKKTI